MARKVGPVLADILEAIEGIQQATDGKSFVDFQQDWLLRHAVQRAIEIISEASKHIPDHLKETQPRFPGRSSRASATCSGTNITRSPTKLSGPS